MKLKTFNEDRTAFLSYLSAVKRRALNTMRAYEQDLSAFASWAARGMKDHRRPDLRELTAFASFLQSRGLSSGTISRRIIGLRQLYRYLRLERRVSEDVALLFDSLGRSSGPRKLPRVLSPDEVRRIIEATTTLRNRAIIESLFSSGCRVSELAGLRLDDLDLATGTAKVTGKGSKQRLVFLTPAAVASIRDYLASREGLPLSPFVFVSRKGGPLSRNQIFLVIQGSARRAGIGGKIGPHSFRHACASGLLANGADLRTIQLILGHASISTTTIYASLTPQQVQAVHARCHPR